MQRDVSKVEKDIMLKIERGELKMRPKIYFVFGSILTFVGIVSSIATSVFVVGLLRFVFRSSGRMFGGNRMDYLLSVFPWWLPIVALIGVVVGIVLIRKYDFSYKVDLKKGIVLIILAVIVSGFVIDALGFNDLLSRRGMMRGMFMGNQNSPRFEQK